MTSCIKGYRYLPSIYNTLVEIRAILDANNDSDTFNAESIFIALNKDGDLVFEQKKLTVQSIEILDDIHLSFSLDNVPVQELVPVQEPIKLSNEKNIHTPVYLAPIIIDTRDPLHLSTSSTIVKTYASPSQPAVVLLKQFERFRVKNPPRL